MPFIPISRYLPKCTQAAILAGLFAASGLAHAHYFCVSTAQELQDALTQSSNGGMYNGEDNDIYVVHGTYKTGAVTNNAPFFFYSPTSTHSIGIFGGYSAGCSAPTPQTPPTKLDGNGTTGVLTLRNTYGSVTVRGLTLQNGESAQPGAGLQVNYLITVNANVSIQDNIIRNNHSSVVGGGLYASGAGFYMEVFSNLITGNSADDHYGAGYVTGYGNYNEVWSNTVTQNTSAAAGAPVGGLYCGGTTLCQIYNNIFWNNMGIGLYLGSNTAHVDYNDYGTLGGAAPAQQAGNMSVNPKFVDASGGNFHLAGDSPLLGVSPIFTHTIDLDGNPATTAGKIDMGAYEETIFIDGLDGN